MSDIVIAAEHISKQYRLGEVNTGSLSQDLNIAWHRLRGKTNPYLKLTDTNDRSKSAKSDYVWALKDVNFTIRAGQVTGIIGRNGAGKSTLLKILSRTTAPTMGTMKIKGRLASLLEVGTGFHPDLSGRENIFLNGAILGMQKNEIRKKFDEIVSFSGVEKYIDTPVKRYSSGMYVRLAFAVAAHLESEILVVDEVLAVGDTEFQRKCLGRMQDVSRQDGRTVLFVSHNMAAVENLCQESIVMNHGTIHSISDTSQAIRTYLSLNENIASESELSNRLDRQGTGVLKFSKILIPDTNGQPLNAVASGDDISFRIFFQKQENQVMENVHLAIGINDMYDNRISHINNDLIDVKIDDIINEGNAIDIIIPKLPLNSGEFSLTVFCTVNGEIADWVQNAFYFTIEGGDFYSTGKTTPKNGGSFLFDFKFGSARF